MNLYVCKWCSCHSTVWRSGENLLESVLAFHYVGSRIWTQIVKLGCKLVSLDISQSPKIVKDLFLIVSAPIHSLQRPDVRFLGAGVTGGYEPSDMGYRNRAGVLWKASVPF